MTDPVRVEKHGVVVTKTVDTDVEGGVRVTLTIESTWRGSIAIRVREAVPSAGTVGLPGDQTECWDANDDELTFERTLEPEATVTAAYEVVTDDVDRVLDDVRAEPDVEVAEAPAAVPERRPRVRGGCVSTYGGPSARSDPPETTDEADGESGHAAIADPGAADSDARTLFESLDGFSMPEDEMSVADVLGQSSNDDRPDGGEGHDSPDGERSPGDRPTACTSSGDGDDRDAVDRTGDERRADADARATDLAVVADASGTPPSGERSDERFDRFRRELTGSDRPGRSLEVRVLYLQARFQELEAYLDAMEEFIDEHGSGEELLAALTDDVEGVKRALERIEGECGELRSSVERTDERIDAVESAFESHRKAAEEERRTLERSIDAVTERQRELGDDVEELERFRESLRDAF